MKLHVANAFAISAAYQRVSKTFGQPGLSGSGRALENEILLGLQSVQECVEFAGFYEAAVFQNGSNGVRRLALRLGERRKNAYGPLEGIY